MGIPTQLSWNWLAMSNVPPKTARAQTVVTDSTFKAVVAAHLPGAKFIRAFRLSGGVSADVYRLELEAGDGAHRSVVLRVHGPNHNGHPAALEFGILSAVSGLGICAPQALALDESLRHIPHPFLILDHIDGETAFPTGGAVNQMTRMAETLAEIHSLPIAGLPTLPMRGDPLPEIFDYLPQDAEFEALRQGLSRMENTAYEGSGALLHGDFWPGNLLWKGPHIVGILDWEDAACGDPLSDVACTALELTYVAGTEGAEQFVRAYGRLRPIEPRRFALWQIYVAAAGHLSMGGWGLEASREAHMRATALSVIRQASALVI
jgi:aminoglycoside phosphotransferase (APT) family kinase protein